MIKKIRKKVLFVMLWTQRRNKDPQRFCQGTLARCTASLLDQLMPLIVLKAITAARVADGSVLGPQWVHCRCHCGGLSWRRCQLKREWLAWHMAWISVPTGASSTGRTFQAIPKNPCHIPFNFRHIYQKILKKSIVPILPQHGRHLNRTPRSVL